MVCCSEYNINLVFRYYRNAKKYLNNSNFFID